jgi:hypothetical protein
MTRKLALAKVAKRYGQSLNLLSAVAVIAVCIGSAEAQNRPADSKSGFVEFSKFVIQTSAAQASDYVGKDKARVRDERAFEEMKAHLLDLYRGVHVRHSFVEAGNNVDCIPIDEQPGLRGASDAEKREARHPDKQVGSPKAQYGRQVPGTTQNLDITLPRGKRDVFGNSISCALGTIPMRRITLEDMVRFPTLNEFLHVGKIDDGSLDRRPSRDPGDAARHYYARGVQFVDNLGADAWFNVWSPTVKPHEESLSQLWVVGGDGKTKQTVEAGWQVLPDKWKSDQAALFVYFTADGYDKTGCYNTECDNSFVQVANNVYLARGFDHYSATNAGQWGFNLQWKRNANGNWWMYYKGPGNYIPVGYYKKAIFGTGALASRASKVAFAGEASTVPSALQIGSGKFASEGWQKAAFVKSAFYIDTSGTSQWANLSPQEVVHECYTTDIHNIFGDWGTYLFFGGPKCDVTPPD